MQVVKPGPATARDQRTESSTPRTEHAAHDAGLYAYSDQVDSWIVRANKPVSYEVRFCDNLLEPANPDLAGAGGQVGATRRRFVVIDSTVDLLYGDRIRTYFERWGIEVGICVVAADETRKGIDTIETVVQQLDRFGVSRRNEPIVAIGGGVLTDIVGLASSLYRRGTPFIRVPTTLIGIVDAGVGIKTGVNFNGHKNRLGSYFPADLTLLDRSFLATVEPRHVSNGMAEILKMALIKDRELFTLLEQHGRTLLDQKFQGFSLAGDRAARSVLQRAIHGMLDELHHNLWEATLERRVDYGHSFSPTLEMRAMPALLHGEAVCIDMALTTVIAWQRATITADDRDRVFELMQALGLPSWHVLLDDPTTVVNALEDAVRHRDGKQRLPLPVGIGKAAFVNDVTEEEIASALRTQRRLGTAPESLATLGKAPNDRAQFLRS